jgi:ADP-ribose pyrophosphatase YjhB (NUDIX family)
LNLHSHPRRASRRNYSREHAGDRETDSRGTRLARPMVAVDTVLFAVKDGRLETYLIELARGTVRGRWAFPGGLVRVGELLDDAARRELRASTGLTSAYLEQLFTFGDPSRDPRAHVVSVAYMALVADPREVGGPGEKYATGKWFEVTRLPELAFDHSLMAAYALKRLKSKLEYTNIAYALLPHEFTFAEFEELYSLILGRPLDRRNFRRRILAMGILKCLPHTRRGPHRPAALYSFANQSLRFIEML